MSDFSLPTKRDVRKEVQTHSAMQSNLSRQENDIKSRQSNSFTASSNDPFTTPTRDNYQTYPYDYYSGSDVKIYFGDIFVDEIITIQYNVSQSKTPIYGYASQYFDGIAKGQVLVEGTLSINFKETGYLNIIQATLEAQKGNASSVIKSKINEITEENKYGLAKFVPGLNYIGNQPNPEPYTLAYSANGTPQFIRQQQTIEDIIASKKKNTSAAVAKTLGVQNKQRDFEDFAEILEDTLWGDSNGKAFDLNNKLKRADEFDYNSFGGITIAKNRNYANVLNILISFGDITDYRAEHTITVLNDVHFTSTSMICSPTGDPIAEVYTFIARDINDSINNRTIKVNPIKLNIGNDNITLSKLEDIDKIQNQLDKVNNTFTIKFEAAYGSDGWIPYQGEIEFIFVQSNVEPFVDYLCKRVEDNINALYVPEIVKTLYEQYIVKVIPNDFSNSITMILEQKTKGTRSYKVISPTRSNYGSVSIISRDDLFDAKVLKSNPLPPKKDPNQKKNESVAEVENLNTSPEIEMELVRQETQKQIGQSKEIPKKERLITKEQVEKTKKQYYNSFSRAHQQFPDVSVDELAAFATQESNGKINATSSAGAQGILQITPKTYAEMVKKYNLTSTGTGNISNPYSPANQALVAAAYISENKRRYGNDLEKVYASYNAGPGAVNRYDGVPPYNETQEYVKSIGGVLFPKLPENTLLKEDETFD